MGRVHPPAALVPQGLLDASDLERKTESGRLQTIPGSVPGAGRFPEGCVFRNRCAHATERCETLPRWSGDATHGYACWHPVGGERG